MRPTTLCFCGEIKKTKKKNIYDNLYNYPSLSMRYEVNAVSHQSLTLLLLNLVLPAFANSVDPEAN